MNTTLISYEAYMQQLKQQIPQFGETYVDPKEVKGLTEVLYPLYMSSPVEKHQGMDLIAKTVAVENLSEFVSFAENCPVTLFRIETISIPSKFGKYKIRFAEINEQS